MADSFTANINIRKPEVGGAFDTWGGAAGWNNNADLIDAIFLATGLGTSVGLHVGNGQVLNVDGTGQLQTQNFQFVDRTDTTKRMAFAADALPTGTLVTVQAPANSGTMATQEFVNAKIPTGTIWHGYYGTTPPAGWLFPDGRTIGDASSLATNRANADCLTLFTQLWNMDFPVVGGRGTSAALDWAAHKQLTLPDHSGRVMAARDNLSGTSRGLLSNYASTTYGTTFGQQQITVAVSVNVSGGISGSTSGAQYFDWYSASDGVSGGNWYGGIVGSGDVLHGNHYHNVHVSGWTQGQALGVSGSFSGSGSGNTAQIATVQPSIICDAIIKL